MNIIDKVKSWSGNKDCFGNGTPKTVDHIYPRAEGGSNIFENKQFLSKKSNSLKGEKNKGKIGENWRFAIVKKTTSNDEVYGIMYIRNIDWEEGNWKEVIPKESVPYLSSFWN